MTLTNLGIDHDFYEADSQGVGLISDWDKLSQYQVLFLPCASGWLDNYLSDQGTLDTLRNFVSAGGRLYVTDWSYDILVNAFPDPVTFVGDTGSLGSAQGSVYDADAWVEDIGLEAWLGAQGIVDFILEANWTEIESVNVYEAPNELNIIQVFLPKVWVRGKSQDSSGGGSLRHSKRWMRALARRMQIPRIRRNPMQRWRTKPVPRKASARPQ